MPKHPTIEQLKEHASPFVKAQLEAIEVAEKQPKRNKFNARKIEYKGMIFDSKHELSEYQKLEVMHRAGLIGEVWTQVEFELIPKQKGVRRCCYYADFVYLQDDELVVVDAKSEHTRTLPVYRMKKKMMLSVHKIQIKEV